MLHFPTFCSQNMHTGSLFTQEMSPAILTAIRDMICVQNSQVNVSRPPNLTLHS